jgi:hypothetical protein
VPRYGRIDSDYGRRLRSAAGLDDGPIYMLNLTKFLPGNPAAVDSHDGSGRYAASSYAPIPLLTSAGAALCFVADVVAGSADWDRVAVVGYPTRESFLDLSARPDFRGWHASKQAGVERTTVLGTLPVAGLPAEPGSSRILLEIWNGPEPEPVTDGPATPFEVEGTIVGDGRTWTGTRYTTIVPGTALPLQEPRPDYQALLLEPRIARWR